MSHQHQGVVVSQSPSKGVPVPAHDLNGISNGTSNQQGANPRPGWSQCKKQTTQLVKSTAFFTIFITDVGPAHKAPPPVATQLVVPLELSDGPVTLTCYSCQV